ncbi:MAG: cardiolipin synthase [Clostridia bacterium]|nr:cardiolipin synthase [Clostridia bacterium]
MKSKKTLLFASRFVIIFLAIILQVASIWVLFAMLGVKYVWVDALFKIAGAVLFFSIINKDKPAVYKLPWVIVILLAPLMGIVIYYTFGNVKLSKKQMRKFRRIYDEKHDEYYKQSEIFSQMEKDGLMGAGAIKYVKSTTSLPVFNNSKTTYLPSGETFFESLCEELLKAEKYIFLEYFIVEEGQMLDGVLKALEDRINHGVKIYFMYDDVGSIAKVESKFDKKLRAKGINARKFFKFVPIASVIHNNRDHRKIAVIDGKVGFMSGANIADEYINVKKPFGRWLDNAIKIEGQATDNLVKLFIQLYNLTGGETLKEEDFISVEHTNFSDGYVLPFGDSPSPIDKDRIAEGVYLDVISRAQKYLYITTPYLIVDTNILDALKHAVKRGVDVRIIIPKIPDKKAVYSLTKSECRNLKKEGVRIYAYKDGFIHSKTVLADGEIAIVGTANFDFRSFVHHFECATLLCKTSSINDIYEDFLRLFDRETVEFTERELTLKWYERPIKAIINIIAPLM